MDHEDGKQALTGFLKKYRWAAVVVLVGVFLLALPEGTEDPVPQPQISQSEPGLQQQLEALLSELQGAGAVRLLLTESAGEQIQFQTDEENTGERIRRETVLTTGSDRGEAGLIRRVDPPLWQGAVVLCQGADSPVVRLAVVEAVSAATGLTSDRISVLKMK